ncbi:hypothetical protein M9M90_00250 [Phenylobacterium sp. LH3H17]|uniref:hypothetical protein n=1 Tax=Phenylobacterium sp. LH3H17 TaxID=2903901 RepID=UPI0020C9A5A4|nr:hypothetical protein [Phenylobacterium sp. LH3H17]UTP39646.1 hypothetical protein M9M90_00250 [Phenylobacterium sp. LH3H17]
MAAARWGLARTFPLMMIGALVVGMTAVAVTSYQNRIHKIAESEAATTPSALTGLPCPVLTKAEFDALAVKPSKTFIFNEVTFVRRFGHVTCNVISHGGGTGFAPLCEFTAPAVLKVTTRQGEFYFKTGVGKPVSVSTPGGIPKCVVAAR